MNRKTRLFTMLWMGLCCVVAAKAEQAGRSASPPPGPVTLDLDPAAGDQGRREVRGVKPGTEVVVEIVALKGAKGATGFTITLTFDAAQIVYEGFEAGGLIPQMQTLPLLKGGTLEVGGSQFGGGPGAAQDTGTLGVVRFKTTSRFKAQTVISLTRARYRKQGEMKNLEVQARVVIRR